MKAIINRVATPDIVEMVHRRRQVAEQALVHGQE
jgi:hypothetical protein